MTRLIDADELEQKFANLEATALNYIGKLNERQDPEEHERWVMWTAILNERTAYKYELIDAPTVDAIPIEYIKKRCDTLNEFISECGGDLDHDELVNKHIYEVSALVRLMADWYAQRNKGWHAERKEE